MQLDELIYLWKQLTKFATEYYNVASDGYFQIIETKRCVEIEIRTLNPDFDGGF